MQRLMRSGVPVSEAAARVRSSAPDEVAVDPAPESPDAMPTSVRGLWEAAQALDGQRCAHMVADSVRAVGVLPSWDNLIAPTLQRAGEQWESKRAGIDVEHILSDAVTAGLFLDGPVKREGVLLAATSTEDHVLPLYALRAALAEHGIGAELLTARTPASALAEATRRLHPGVIVLWAQLPENADLQGFAQIPGIRPRPVLALAGPGWPETADFTRLTGLREAVNFVRAHV